MPPALRAKFAERSLELRLGEFNPAWQPLSDEVVYTFGSSPSLSVIGAEITYVGV